MSFVEVGCADARFKIAFAGQRFSEKILVIHGFRINHFKDGERSII